MNPREKPSLKELQPDLLHRTRELHRALIAPEGSIEAPPPSTSEKAALAVNKGLLKLRRAAYHARSGNVAASAPAVDAMGADACAGCHANQPAYLVPVPP